MAQSNPITIQGWPKGVGASPYVGFGKMVGMDIFRKPGVIQAGVSLNQWDLGHSSGYITSRPTVEVTDSSGNLFTGFSDGTIKYGSFTIATTGKVIHDMVIVNDYLVISKSDTELSLYGPISGAASFTLSWKTGMELSTNGWKKMFVGQDNVIYIGNETKLASITGIASSIGSWTLNTSCLSTGIPQSRVIQTICEINRYVAIMTTVGNGTYGSAVLYYMDRGLKDTLGTSFFLTIGVPIPERFINQMVNQNNRLLFFGCDTGTIYTSNTVTYSPIAVIPGRLQAQNYTTYANAVAIINNEVLFGIGGSFNTAFDTVYGVYSIRGNSLITKNTISSGEYGQTTSVAIGFISAFPNGTYHVGWQTGLSTFGIDLADYRIGANYTCWFESPLYETGEALKPRTFQTAQFNFGNNLVSGQALKIYYRQSSNAPWVYYATYSYSGTTLTMTFWDGTTSSQVLPSNQSGFNSFASKFPVTLTTNVQVKVPFDTGNAPYGSNIELQSIILI